MLVEAIRANFKPNKPKAPPNKIDPKPFKKLRGKIKLKIEAPPKSDNVIPTVNAIVPPIWLN